MNIKQRNHLIFLRALCQWDYWSSPREKMEQIFGKEKPDMPREEDGWWMEKEWMLQKSGISGWIQRFDFPTQGRIVQVVMESRGDEAADWVEEHTPTKEKHSLAIVAAKIIDDIDKFDEECQEGEYTDTDKVWQLLNAWREELLHAD